MNRIIYFLSKLGFWPFVILFTVLAVIISEILIVVQSYWLTGEFFDKNLLIVGFITPAIDGFIIFLLTAFLLRYLKQLQDAKDEILLVQKRTEEKLKKSESYQRALLDSFPFLFWLKDTQSNFLAVNKTFAEATGIDDPSKLIGKNDLDVWPEDLAKAYRSDDKTVMESLEKKEIVEMIEDNGERRWHETYKAPILDKEGSLFGTVGFARDITKNKKAEEDLKLSASVFTYAREGIIITDVDQNIINVNQAFVDITGYSHSEVLGKNPNILQSGRQGENFYTQLWNTLKRDGVWQGEIWNKKKNGEEYAEHLTISAIYDDNNAVQNYVALFTDITLQKQQQEELEHIAHYDMLTNLPNRVLFYDRMQQAISQASRRGQLISIVYIDLDGFKEVNDTYGHNVGDQLLILLARRMHEQLRAGDSISRIGGDEFIALLIDISDKTSVISFIMRLLEIIAEPVPIDDLIINVSASIGVTFYPQDEELNADQIIKQADQAMYQAKLSGKNRYFIFNTKDKI